jgi:pimeloyl-ACP methyl ester carboxylesterase
MSSVLRVLFFGLLLGAFGACCAAEKSVELRTMTGTLQGTLRTPEAPGRGPVLLLIAGSGPTDRDGNTPLASGRNDSLKMLAGALAEAGFASVRYDKRGIAASAAAGPVEAALRFDHYVRDAAAWVRQLAADARFSSVTVLGHSEGALIGLLAAQQSPAVAYVSVAGPAERASVLLRRQLGGQLPADLLAQNESILATLEAGRTVTEVPAPLQTLYRPSVQPYLISWFRFEPRAEIARLRLPCLILQGDTDLQVSMADAQALAAANPRCERKVLAGMNHVLKRVAPERAQQIASYGDPTLPLHADLLPALTRFLAQAGATLAPMPR